MSSAKSSSGLSVGDTKFVKEAADGGMAEVELGKLAQDKGSSSAVKQFGQRMVDDHGKANDQLKQLALRKKKIELPQEPSAKTLQGHYCAARKTVRLNFDKAYVAEMLKDHKEDVATFQRETLGERPGFKEFRGANSSDPAGALEASARSL